MATLNWAITLQVMGGPTISAGLDNQDVQAIDRIDVTIAPDDDEKEISIQPGAADKVHLIVIQSDHYDKNLSFVASDENGDSERVVLDSPQLFSSGAMALFNVDPRQFTFKNASDTAAHVTVLVARNAEVV